MTILRVLTINIGKMTVSGIWEKYMCVIAWSMWETHPQCICDPWSVGRPRYGRDYGRSLQLSQGLQSLKMSNSGLLYARQVLQNKPTAATKVNTKDCWPQEKFCCFKNWLTDPNEKATQCLYTYKKL